MDLCLDFSDRVGVGVSQRGLEVLAVETIQASRYGGTLAEKIVTIDAVIISASEMKNVHQQLRGTSQVTDVLSVGSYSDEKSLTEETATQIMLGEIILCWSDIKKNAIIQHTAVQWEYAYVFTHGILHLLGYAHSTEMFAIQKQISDTYSKMIL